MIGKIGLAFAVAMNVVVLAILRGASDADPDPVGDYGFEFRANLWEPGKEILHGNSPYDPVYPRRALAEDLDCCLQALYPAPTHVLFAPFSLLSFEVGMLVFTALAAASLLGGLWLLGMRSAAAYALVLMLPPVWTSFGAGGVMPFLVLGCALCWRWRDRPVLGGLAVAATAVLKVFLWPLWLWLLFTRRYRAAVIAAVSAVAMLAGGWAVFGFEHLVDYPRMLMNVTELEVDDGLSLARVGGEWLGAGAFAALLVLGRQSFPIMIVAALALTPIVWLQTLTILLVPLVLAFTHPHAFANVRFLRGATAAAAPSSSSCERSPIQARTRPRET